MCTDAKSSFTSNAQFIFQACQSGKLPDLPKKSIEHGDGSMKYSVISGIIRIPDDRLATSPANQVLVLAIEHSDGSKKYSVISVITRIWIQIQKTLVQSIQILRKF